MRHDSEIDVDIAFSAHLCGIGFGIATIVSLVPAVTALLRALN
jgi:hypothetical protein